jgi:hypothetical protein
MPPTLFGSDSEGLTTPELLFIIMASFPRFMQWCLVFVLIVFTLVYHSRHLDLVVGAGAGDTRGVAVEGCRMHEGKRLGSASESPRVEWLTEKAFPERLDFFSDSWYMNVDLFREMDVSEDSIETVESACFAAYEDRMDLVRMSLDWLDFSVEHMSRWWRRLGCPGDPLALNVTVGTLSSYIERHGHRQAPFRDSHLLRPTLAMIAFQQYRDSDGNESISRGDYAVTTTSLGATIASLAQVGMGRIVVVGYEPTDEKIVLDTFRLLSGDGSDSGTPADNASTRIPTEASRLHGSELAYVRATDDLVASSMLRRTCPGPRWRD